MDIKKLIGNFKKYGISNPKSSRLIDLKESLGKNLKNIIKKNNKLKTQIIKSKQQLKINQLIDKNISDL